MTIDAYLSALEGLLPRPARRRALAEVREHLRDAAAHHRTSGLSPFDAEAAATRDFGPVSEVAARLRSELAVRATRLAAVLAFASATFFVFPLYVIPENTLRPAPWAAKPDVAVLQQSALGLWILGLVFAAIGVALAWTRASRHSSYLLFATVVALTGSIAVSVALVARWFAVTPSTPNWALAAPLALAALLACAGAAIWARASVRRLDPSA